MYSDKLTDEADWKDGIHAFRLKTLQRIQNLEAQIEMLMIRIRDLEEPPKAPHPPKQEEEMKL